MAGCSCLFNPESCLPGHNHTIARFHTHHPRGAYRTQGHGADACESSLVFRACSGLQHALQRRPAVFPRCAHAAVVRKQREAITLPVTYMPHCWCSWRAMNTLSVARIQHSIARVAAATRVMTHLPAPCVYLAQARAARNSHGQLHADSCAGRTYTRAVPHSALPTPSNTGTAREPTHHDPPHAALLAVHAHAALLHLPRARCGPPAWTNSPPQAS